MTTKTYCDICDESITRNYVSKRLSLKRIEFTAEIMIKQGDKYNTGDLCRDCVMLILKEGKEVK